MRHFDELLEQLRDKLLRMSELVQSAIHDSARSIREKDLSLAERVLKGESQINQMELEIDALATSLLALEQPVAADLRFITAATKINNNLERIGDLAQNVAERAQALIHESRVEVRVDIFQLADLVESMVERALDAFVRKDPQQARRVLLSDDGVDALRDSIFAQLITCMKKNSQAVQYSVDLMFAARSLERIADHATNIAESVLYMTEGIDVRHHAEARP
jgi:phosphate transport system protein